MVTGAYNEAVALEQAVHELLLEAHGGHPEGREPGSDA